MPTVVDSSGWIEYLIDGPNCRHFSSAIQETEELVVPSISIAEVYRWVMQEASSASALTIAASMKQGTVIPLDERLAMVAAEVSHRYKLPLADGIIYATALENSAVLLTQDADLDGLPGVSYFKHPKKKH